MISHDFIFDAKLPFREKCQKIYQYQTDRNSVYSTFINALGLGSITYPSPDEIPLLPIRAFKQKPLLCDGLDPQLIFKSSGTSGMIRSKHFVVSPEIYKEAIETGFYTHFPPDKYALLCYLPGYQDNPDSSLIWMANHLIKNDTDGLNRYFPEIPAELEKWIHQVENSGKHILIFGAAFGLIDFLEDNTITFPKTTEIIETGGMKTHRREINKSQLRQILSDGFGISQNQIHSEYGMCELMSQMYSIGGEWFKSPHWVKVSIRNPEKPSEIYASGEEGKIGIIDLANIHSCPFLLTEDRGVMNSRGEFRVLGRWNPDNLRGCNFLIDGN